MDNTRGYVGLSSATYGTLKVGRQYAFSNDLINGYDPTGGSYAFSLLGNSGTLGGGLGLTEMARYNSSIEYVYDYKGLSTPASCRRSAALPRATAPRRLTRSTSAGTTGLLDRWRLFAC